MIYDCFTFFNEIDLLKLRFNILYDYVDFFVISEANKTHTGAQKEFIFEKNQEIFQKFKDKIIYIKVDDFPSLKESDSDKYGNKWLYENFQRDALLRGLKNCKDEDIIIISDCDEIPNPKAIKKYRNGISILKQLTFYYSLNTLNITAPFSKGAKICRYKDLINPNQKLKDIEYCAYSKYGMPTYLRFCKGKKIKNGGWHFSYLGEIEKIIEKRKSIVEQQFNNKENMEYENIQKTIDEGKDILGRDYRFVNLKLGKVFPKHLIENKKEYEKLINKKKNISVYLAFLRFFFSKIISIKNKNNEFKILKILGIKFKIKNRRKSENI